MNPKNFLLYECLFGLILQICFIPILKSQEMIVGVVADKIVQISPVNGALTELATLTPNLSESLREVTYHPDNCLLYGFIDAFTVPKLVSIDLDGNTSVIGTITLPGNTVADVEAISYNAADGEVYVSARLNLPVGPGLYFSASILRLNVDNAVCSLVGNVMTSIVMADIDGMTHYNGDFFTVDASSPPNNNSWARFFRFPMSLIGSGNNIFQVTVINPFPSSIDLTVYQDEVYFTHNRRLYKGDPVNFALQFVGQMHTAAEFGGVPLEAITTVTPSSIDGISLGPDLELCNGETATLQITEEPGASFVWSNGATGPAISVSSSGTYWVQASLGICSTVSDTVVVNFNNEPTSVNLGPDLELCSGETATLQIPEEAGASILWSNGATGPVNPVSTSGTYWVQVTLGTCEPVSDTVVVSFTPGPMPVNLGPDLELCSGETATLEIVEEAGATIVWSDGANGPAITVNSSGTYWVQVTLGNCAPVSDTVVVNFNNEPMPVNLGPDLELCAGETAILQIPEEAGASILWSNGATGPTINVSSSGTYWVQVTLGTFEPVSDTVVVSFTPGPMPVTLGPDLEICSGETATLQIPQEAGASILWSNGVTGPVNPVSTSGTYGVQVTLGTCAPVSDTIVVNFNNEPMPVSLGPDLELCSGETATLQIPQEAGASILWSNGAIGPAITVSSSGTYWVQVTLGTCEPVSDTVVVSFTPGPMPVNLGPDLELCSGETATLQIPQEAGASIVWSNGVTGPVNPVSTSGTYGVQVTLDTCGSVSDTVVVNFIQCPDLNCTYKYFIPNVFSPNDDGINDKFEVYINPVSCILESIQMQIFDRWGELVYQGTSLSAWDGVFRGKKAMSGVYVYMINLAFNRGGITETVFEKGDVTLIR
ncbi:MAG: gliding motility-associated C-terminal domain-containing protein [Saprospiraceae bacterium]